MFVCSGGGGGWGRGGMVLKHLYGESAQYYLIKHEHLYNVLYYSMLSVAVFLLLSVLVLCKC